MRWFSRIIRNTDVSTVAILVAVGSGHGLAVVGSVAGDQFSYLLGTGIAFVGLVLLIWWFTAQTRKARIQERLMTEEAKILQQESRRLDADLRAFMAEVDARARHQGTVEQWLQECRDRYPDDDDDRIWQTLDALLTEYRQHLAYGTPLIRL